MPTPTSLRSSGRWTCWARWPATPPRCLRRQWTTCCACWTRRSRRSRQARQRCVCGGRGSRYRGVRSSRAEQHDAGQIKPLTFDLLWCADPVVRGRPDAGTHGVAGHLFAGGPAAPGAAVAPGKHVLPGAHILKWSMPDGGPHESPRVQANSLSKHQVCLTIHFLINP